MRDAIKHQIEHITARWVTDAQLRRNVLGVLHRPSFPLAPESPCAFGTLAALAYDAAAGKDERLRVDAAATAELFIAASYVLDHAMDDEVPANTSLPKEIALGTTLVLLAVAALGNVASRALPANRRSLVTSEAYRLLLNSCAGQVQELEIMESGAASLAAYTTDEALSLTQMKAGSLGRLGGIVGAGLAGAEPDLVDTIGECCALHTTYLQLLDDLNDAGASPDSDRKSDASANKPTLPLVFLRNSLIESHASNQDTSGSTDIMKAMNGAKSVTANELRETGAELFTKMAAEVVRNRAIGLADGLERKVGTPLGLAAFIRAASRGHDQHTFEPSATTSEPDKP